MLRLISFAHLSHAILREICIYKIGSTYYIYPKYWDTLPWGYKTIFMLNSAEHEIFPANKSQIANNCKFFLNIAEHENFSANKYENANYCWHFHIY